MAMVSWSCVEHSSAQVALLIKIEYNKVIRRHFGGWKLNACQCSKLSSPLSGMNLTPM